MPLAISVSIPQSSNHGVGQRFTGEGVLRGSCGGPDWNVGGFFLGGGPVTQMELRGPLGIWVHHTPNLHRAQPDKGSLPATSTVDHRSTPWQFPGPVTWCQFCGVFPSGRGPHHPPIPSWATSVQTTNSLLDHEHRPNHPRQSCRRSGTEAPGSSARPPDHEALLPVE